MRTFYPYTKGYRQWILLGVACSIAEAVLELELPQAMSEIVDVGIANGDRTYILLTGLKMLVLALLAGALIAEFGDPTLQTRVRSRIGNDIRTEFRILVRDFRQEHGIGVRILHGRHRGIEIDHHDLLVSWSVTILLNDS